MSTPLIQLDRKKTTTKAAHAKAPVAAGNQPDAATVFRSLRDLLNRIAGTKVRLDVDGNLTDTEGNPVEGRYWRGLISVALDAANAEGTARHEAIHFLKEIGAFPPAVWQALEKQAATWRKQYRIDQRYDGLSESELNEEAIAEVLSIWTGIPVYKLTEEETAKLLNMEAELHKRIIAQEDAIKAVSQSRAKERRIITSERGCVWLNIITKVPSCRRIPAPLEWPMPNIALALTGGGARALHDLDRTGLAVAAEEQTVCTREFTSLDDGAVGDGQDEVLAVAAVAVAARTVATVLGTTLRAVVVVDQRGHVGVDPQDHRAARGDFDHVIDDLRVESVPHHPAGEGEQEHSLARAEFGERRVLLVGLTVEDTLVRPQQVERGEDHAGGADHDPPTKIGRAHV